MIGFRDSAGIEWTVMEIEASTLASLPRNSLRHPEFKDGWLLFQSEETRKRLAPYPKNWRELSADQLEELCRQARQELARPTTGEYRAIESERGR
jgi:hypothetical protein